MNAAFASGALPLLGSTGSNVMTQVARLLGVGMVSVQRACTQLYALCVCCACVCDGDTLSNVVTQVARLLGVGMVGGCTHTIVIVLLECV